MVLEKTLLHFIEKLFPLIILILLQTNFSYQLSYQTLHTVDLIQIPRDTKKNRSRMFIPNPTYSRFDSRFKSSRDT